MIKHWIAALIVACILVWGAQADAKSTLRVSPVLLDVRSPAAATAIRIWNESETPVNVQLRVFRWTQDGGEDILEPAEAVAVSPPVTTLQPGSENLIRIVRTAKAAVTREESYRLIVDELPDTSNQQPGTVKVLMRHSIPVFFEPPRLAGPNVTWSTSLQSEGILITARNNGGSRLRIADLALSDGSRVVASQGGLVGYVLAGSSASWLLPTTTRSSADSLTVSASSEQGPISALAKHEGG